MEVGIRSEVILRDHLKNLTDIQDRAIMPTDLVHSPAGSLAMIWLGDYQDGV